MLILWVGWAAWQRRFRGPAILLPACSLATLVLLALQSEGVMEARFREPLDAVLVAAALLIRPRDRPPPRHTSGAPL